MGSSRWSAHSEETSAVVDVGLPMALGSGSAYPRRSRSSTRSVLCVLWLLCMVSTSVLVHSRRTHVCVLAVSCGGC